MWTSAGLCKRVVVVSIRYRSGDGGSTHVRDGRLGQICSLGGSGSPEGEVVGDGTTKLADGLVQLSGIIVRLRVVDLGDTEEVDVSAPQSVHTALEVEVLCAAFTRSATSPF